MKSDKDNSSRQLQARFVYCLLLDAGVRKTLNPFLRSRKLTKYTPAEMQENHVIFTPNTRKFGEKVSRHFFALWCGRFVAHVATADLDSGVNADVSCELNDGSSNSFQLVQLRHNEFKVISTTKLDREQQDVYHIRIVCEVRLQNINFGLNRRSHFR